MTDPTRHPDSNADTRDDTDVEPDNEKTTGLARWQKAIGIIVLVLVLVFVILQVTGVGGGLGDHVPGPPPGGH
jgi:Mn2+/Fe2+ NRAMP family transporter